MGHPLETTQPDSTIVGQMDSDSHLCLVIVASAIAPRRAGEVAFLSKGEEILGREGSLTWGRQRPGSFQNTGALTDPKLSRQQLRLWQTGKNRWEIENKGRQPLFLNRRQVDTCPIRAGDIIQLGRRLGLLVQRRPLNRPDTPEARRFGVADRWGFVGEGPVSWAILEHVRFAANRPEAALIFGPSGSGKELIAKGIANQHLKAQTWVSRSAATIPESLADAELFGNRANYPNPSTPERSGLIGAAAGGTLFLDEIGELPIASQARLLRVMDEGEYTRLGEARSRRADVRFIAATNREPSDLKHDFLARFPLRIHVQGLGARREDIPLMIRRLLESMADSDSKSSDATQLSVDFDLQMALVAHPYTTHVRELSVLLWHAKRLSRDGILRKWANFPVLHDATDSAEEPSASMEHFRDPDTLTDDELLAALERNEGRRTPTWQELGLSSRHVLGRLLKKRGLA